MPQCARQAGEQPLDMRAGMDQAALARAARRGPAGIEPVGRGDGEKPDIAAVFRHQADGLDRFRRDRAGIGDDDLAIRARARAANRRRRRSPGAARASSSRLICSIGRVDSRR